MNSKTAWPLLEQLPSGHLKENLTEIKKALETIQEANDMLLTFGKWKKDCEEDTITLAVDTVFDIGCHIDLMPDTVYHYLNQIFGKGIPEQAKSIVDVSDNLKTRAKEAEEAPELSAYKPGYANAKVSVISLWKHLDALEAVADSPGRVKAWAEMIFNELGKCQVA